MIAHIDADAFFASVLQRVHPKLQGKPLLALGMGGGCVIAASYEAKAYGVKTGMRFAEAKKLCPHVLSMPSDFAQTALASKSIETVLENHVQCLEQMSVDEWYADLKSVPGGVPADLLNWARAVQSEIVSKVQIGVSIGVAPSKILAKMASEYRKPRGITVVDSLADISIEQFLKDRLAQAVPGIGSRRNLHSGTYGWRTAWDIAAADPLIISKLFGKPGREMQQELQGIAVCKVSNETALPKSVSRCRSFPRTKDKTLIFAHLLHHLSYTVLKMRKHFLMCKCCAVWLRNEEYRHESKEMQMSEYVHTEEKILPYVQFAFDRLIIRHPVCTQVGLALYDLRQRGGVQQSLFEKPGSTGKDEDTQKTLDDLHRRYGRDSLVRAAALPIKSGMKRGLSVL